MTGTTLFEWLLYWSNLTFSFAANVLVHSTVIIIIGLLVKHALRKRSATLQSFILRACLIAVFVSPFASSFFHAAGLKGFDIPIVFINRMKQVYSPSQDDQKAMLLQSSVRLEGDLSRSADADELKFPDAATQRVKEGPVDLHEIQRDHDIAKIPAPPVTEQKIPDDISQKIAGLPVDHRGIHRDENYGNVHTLIWKILAIFYILIPAVWAVFSLFLFIKVIVGTLYIWYIYHSAVDAEPKDNKRCRTIAQEIGVKSPLVLQSPYVNRTLLTGLFKPTILLPYREHDIFMASSEVFVHELAHLLRHDFVWNQLGRIGKIILPLQPLMRVLTRQIEEVSDYVCDEYVIEYMKNRHSYAAQLLNMVQSFKPHIPEFTPGVGIISTKSQLRRRIERILDRSHSLSMKTRAREVVSVSVLFMTTIILTGFVNFREKSLPDMADRTDAIHQTITDIPTGIDHPENDLFDLSSLEDTVGVRKENVEKTAIKTNTDENQIEESESIFEDTLAFTGQTPLKTESVTFEQSSETRPAESEEEPLDTGLIASADRISTEEKYITDSASSEKRSIDLPVNAISGKEHSPPIESEKVVNKAQTEEPGIITGQESETSTGSLFNVSNAGMKLAGFRDNKIKMPVAKAVNVTIEKDYENFDLRNEEERREYSIYHGLDKLKNEPAWSPDGKWIAFTDHNRIWIVSPEGGEPKLVYENFHDGFSVGNFENLCFTPDSQEITFKKDIYDVSRGSEVDIYDRNKRDIIDIVDNNEISDRYAVFYNPIPNIESVNISTGEHRVVVEDGFQCCWSNSGRYLCYLNWSIKYIPGMHETGDQGVPVLYDTETGKKVFLSVGDNARYGKPAFSPDDTHIVIPVRKARGPVELYRIPIDGGEPEQLTVHDEDKESGKFINLPEYSPDGQWILYTDFTRSGDQPDKRLFLYSTLTGERFEFFENAITLNSFGKWSPDGKKICYIVEEKDGNYIYICDFDPLRYKLKKPTLETTFPTEFSLHGNYPNPFNLRTTIEYSVPEQGFVNLVIYNIMGQKVRELVSETVEAGVHSAVWDGRDENGSEVASGVYISQLKTGKSVMTRKMTLIK